MNPIQLGGKTISPRHKPFIIAEMSGNHNQSLERALAIVDAAADAGADAIKLQTYTADTMTLKGVYTIEDKNSLWHGKELYDLYSEAYTPWEWHAPIFEHARKRGLLAFSSPFDPTSVDFLETLDVPFYKIASFENTDRQLLKRIAATKKPVIMSTGASRLVDITESVQYLRSCGCTDLILLKCTSSYPASPESTNIMTIPHMASLFNCPVGLSDHTMGIGVAIASIALGARVIEKHFTLRRSDGGVDSVFSLEPAELASLVTESERAFLGLGEVHYEHTKKISGLEFKRSLYFQQAVAAGTVLEEKHIKAVRPGYGLETKYLESILGRTLKKDVTSGTPVSWDLI